MQGYKQRAKRVVELCQFGYRSRSDDFAIGITFGAMIRGACYNERYEDHTYAHAQQRVAAPGWPPC